MNNESTDPVREHREQQERYQELQQWKVRWRTFFAASAALLGAAIVALAMYTYSVAHRPDNSPERITALETTLGTLNQSVDTHFSSWDQQRDQLRAQMEQTGRDLLRRFDGVKKQTTDSVEALSRKLSAQVEKQVASEVAPLRSKVDGIETARQADQAQVASLKDELSKVRGRLDKQALELALAQDKIDALTANGATTQKQVANLSADTMQVQEAANRTRREVDSLNGKLLTDRVDFEVFKGHVRQLTPEISMSLTGVDLPYHRATGWVWVMPDRRTLWLRKQSIQEPLIFYGHDDGKKREVILTGITKNSVVGYLLLPKGSVGSATVAAAH